MTSFRVIRLESMDFLEGCRLQKAYAEARREGLIGDTLLLARHPHTFCTGALGKDEHVLLSEAGRRALGIPYYRVDRGGDVMYLGPGQVVAYPILRLADRGLDPLQYLRALEEVAIRALSEFGIQARRIVGLTGVWVGEAKIGGVAVKLSRGVTTYGFNLNVTPDLSFYRHIVTCGNAGRDVTSMERLLGRAPGLREVEDRVVEGFGAVLGERVEGPSGSVGTDGGRPASNVGEEVEERWGYERYERKELHQRSVGHGRVGADVREVQPRAPLRGVGRGAPLWGG